MDLALLSGFTVLVWVVSWIFVCGNERAAWYDGLYEMFQSDSQMQRITAMMALQILERRGVFSVGKYGDRFLLAPILAILSICLSGDQRWHWCMRRPAELRNPLSQEDMWEFLVIKDIEPAVFN